MSAQTAIPAAIRLILGDEDLDVDWGDKEARWRDDARHIVLSNLSRVRVGVDEKRYAASGPDDVIERIYGNRLLTIQAKIETDDQDLESAASELGDEIAAGFMRTDVLALLEDADLGGPVVSAPRPVDYRDAHGDTRSAIIVEIRFNTHRTHTGATIGRVKAAEVSGTADEQAIGPFEVGPV